ncbi:MAG TPA: LptA/OstA family protein [Castellaniella sp.]|nr:LptA/OstA family protein [Castellaniella sp.]
MKTLSLALSAALILGTFAVPVQAAAPAKTSASEKTSVPAKAAEEPDTVVLSDTLHYDDVTKTSTFTGNVVLTRGTMTLRSDKLVTREDAQGNQSGTATVDKGHLVNVRQENPEKFETLIGQATVVRMICGQAFDNVRGARIVYHQKSATYEAFGGKDSAAAGGRVRSLAQPQSRVDQAIAKCRAKRP